MSQTENLKKIKNVMKRMNIDNFSGMHCTLRDFLLDPKNSVYLQSFMIICSGYMDLSECETRLSEIIKDIEFKMAGGYTYRDLFYMDPDWGEYFKENAYPFPSGQRKSTNDVRRGVDKAYVDEIMKIKEGPPPKNLDEAILEACEIKVLEQT